MFRQYHLIIGIYALLMAIHSITSWAMFTSQIGGSFHSIQEFYLGSPQLMTPPLSRSRLLETAVPHLAAIGLMALVLCHFLIFIPQISPRTKWTLGLAFSLSGLLDIGGGFFVRYYGSVFIVLKALSFLTFQLSYWGILWILIRSALIETHLQHKSRKTSGPAHHP